MSTTQINLSTYYLRINEIKAVFGEGTAQAIKNEIDKKANLSHNHGNLQNNGQVGETVQANKNVVTDSNGKITTENKPTIPTGSSTATDIKMDGTQAAGTSAKFARADHVHPTDTSRAAASHTHDDRYYTETEVDTKLNGKANSSHTHTTSQITDFPSTMTPSSHSHGNITNNGVITNQANKNVVTDSNGKITTESKPTIPTANSTATNIKMDGTQSAGSLSTFAKADHIHPTDTSRAAASHTHDDRYYTETEINTKLNGKSDTSHNHDGTYLKSYTPPTGSTSQAGIVQLNSATNSTSTTQAATPSAVKSAYDLATNKTVTLTKLSTATTGYIATYEIKQGSTSLGKIDIPKDYLVKSGSVKTVSTANSPVNGYAVGDKYIDFVINTKDSSGTDEHVYINVKDLIDIYEPVTQSTNGLMTAADKKKLDGIATGATKNTVSNSLTDTSTTNALSAAKGADLQTQINNIVTGETSTNHNHNTLYYQKTEIDTKLGEKSDTSHTHDDRYYTETEINTKLNGKANSSHTHGFVNNDGTIGGDSDKNKAVITNANGKIATGTIDTSRLSDSAVTSAKIADGTIVNGDISSSAAIATSKISGLDTALSGKAPTSHASTATTYGAGNASNYGHVKVSDNYTSSAGNASQSVAASSQAVKSVYDVANGKTVTLTKLSTATSGYIATYEIKQGTTSLGKIDIPKDYLVKSGSVKSVTTANSPVSGYAVGDKYIDFVINTKDSSGTDEHIYINVKDLIDKYTAGTGLTLSNGAFSVNYGTAAGTACQGNDSRLSNTRTPTDNTVSTAKIQNNAVTSAKIADGTIVNADIASNASIDFSKLNISKANITGLGIPAQDTTYTPASATPLKLVGRTGTVGTSVKYAREDHAHPRYVSYSESNTAADGYFKLFRVSVGSWCNQPFVFKIIRRGATQEHSYKLRFTNVNTNTTLPTVSSLYNTGDSFDLWAYDNKDKTFDIIVKEPETYFECNVEFYDAMNLAVTDLKTRLTATEFNNLTSANLTKSTYIGFTSTEKTKLAGIATGANNYSHPASHPASMITGLSTVATSGSYKDLSNKPSYTATVNTSTSGYYEIGKINLDGTNNVSIYGKDTNTTYTAESTATNIKMNGTQSAGSLSTYAKGDHVHPSDTSRVAVSQGQGNRGKFLKVNTSGNIACESVTIPTKTSQLTNDSNYLTSHQDISGKLDKSQGTSNRGKFLKVNTSGNVACESVTIPTKTSQLTNDSNYLTSHQDISGKLDKSQGTSNSGKFLKVNTSGNVACESVTIPTIGTGASNAAAGNHTHTNWQKVNSASDTNKSLEIYINPDVKMGMAFIKMKSFVISDTNVHPGGFFTYTIELQAAYRPRTITYSPATSNGRVFVWMSAEGQVGYRATAAGTYDIEACITWGYF